MTTIIIITFMKKVVTVIAETSSNKQSDWYSTLMDYGQHRELTDNINSSHAITTGI